MRKIKKIFILFFLITNLTYSQGILDSLRNRLSKAKNDSARVEYYSRMSLSKRINSKTADSLKEKIIPFTKSSDCRIRIMAYHKIGLYYNSISDRELAMSNLLSSLKLAEECKDYWGIAKAYYRMATINYRSQNLKAAISNYESGLAYAKKENLALECAETYDNLGIIYKEIGKIDSAQYYAFKALKIYDSIGNKRGLASALNTIGLNYKRDKNYSKAIEYLKKALVIREEVKDKKGMAACYINLANCLRETNQLKEAMELSQKGTALARDIGEGEFFRNGINSLAQLTYKMGDYKASADYYMRHKEVNDSITIKVNDKNLKELQEKYESEKKDSELKRKEGAISLEKSRSKMRNILLMFALVAVGLAIVAIVFIFRSYKRSRKNALDLAQKNKVIAEKNKEITDSINYAQNIQQSLITGEKVFKENLDDYFVLFKPKDIVSGDFYWAKKTNEGFLIMCADCTGHGVPGAFMSLLGISFLNEITGSLKINTPNEVLNELRKSLIKGFELKDNKDGMDAALIKISGQKIEMAAANNPVWVFRNKINTPLKPNKFPIGKHHGEMQDFALNTLDAQKGDLIIMLTDGYADQFGGPKNKKFKYKNMEQLIIQNSHLPLAQIKEVLDKEITNWKGSNEQVDDILVIGVRV